MSAAAASTNELNFLKKTATVSPLVLLSVVDHFNRVSKDSKKRVVGVILGDNSTDTIKVTNSYAIPFEEDEKTLVFGSWITTISTQWVKCLRKLMLKRN